MVEKEKDLSKAKGGYARDKALTTEEKSAIAKKGAEARWGKNLPQATHQGFIDALGLACYVLEDETRVLSRISFLKAVGWTGKAKGGGEFQTPVFLTAETLKPFIDNELVETSKPINFMYKGQRIIGYKAELLPQVCEMYLKYRDACVAEKRKVLGQYKDIIPKCEILMRGLARIGITGLVDEATGFQYDKAKKALAEILEKFIAKELLKWVKTFPNEFYEQICRLKNVTLADINKRPAYFGKLTNDLVYDRLAPNILDELRKLTPRDEKGRLKHKLFQRLTEDIGHPRLREHLASEITLMRVFDDGQWDLFYNALCKALPKQTKLPLFDKLDNAVAEEKKSLEN